MTNFFFGYNYAVNNKFLYYYQIKMAKKDHESTKKSLELKEEFNKWVATEIESQGKFYKQTTADVLLSQNPVLKEQDEQKEWEEVERRKCTIQEIYEYPIHNSDWTTTIGHWFILKPDVLKDNESKEFTISYAVDEMNISWFKKWQNVLYITSKMERPATDYYKKRFWKDIETDWKREIKPIKSKEK